MAFLNAILAFNVVLGVIENKWLDYVGALSLWALKDTRRTMVMAFKATLLATEVAPGDTSLCFLVPIGLMWPALEIVESVRFGTIGTIVDIPPLFGLLVQAMVYSWPPAKALAVRLLHAGLHISAR